MLSASRVAGDPDSYFDPRFMPDWAADWGIGTADAPPTDSAYLAAAITAGSAGTGIFGLRLMQHGLGDLVACLGQLFPAAGTDMARINAAFGPTTFIHLSRTDTVAQAISLVRAEQTGLWHRAPDGTEVERLSPPAPPVYDFARVDAAVTQIRHANAAWSAWFTGQGCTPLLLTYEALSANPGAAVARVLGALGCPIPPLPPNPAVARLADDLSTEWAHRYRGDSMTRT